MSIFANAPKCLRYVIAALVLVALTPGRGLAQEAGAVQQGQAYHQ